MSRAHKQIKYRFWVRQSNLMVQVRAIDLSTKKVYASEHDGWHFGDGELLEFTGNLDEFNTEIFQDDLIAFKVADKTMVERVWWNGDGWQVGDYENKPLSNFICRVVGNIYQTPQFSERKHLYAGINQTRKNGR